MAKGLRSKVKRRFRTELRKRIGVPHQAKQEEKIQQNLIKAITTQNGGDSVSNLKNLMGSSTTPVAVGNATGMEVDSAADATTETPKKTLKKAKKTAPKRKKKFMQFHSLRKKGV